MKKVIRILKSIPGSKREGGAGLKEKRTSVDLYPRTYEGNPGKVTESAAKVHAHPHDPQPAAVSIPEEIWLLIFTFLQNEVSRGAQDGQLGYGMARIVSVRPLTETCRMFHRICQPLLFETIVIDGRSELSRRRAGCLLGALENKPYLKDMVVKVRIASIFYTISEFWDRLYQTLMELRSIGDLWIREGNISITQLSRFQECPRLERLVLLRVDLSGSEDSTTAVFHSLKHLQCEPYGFPRPTSFFATLMMPKLETLRIDSVFLTGLERICDHQVFQFNPAVLNDLTVETKIDWIPRMGEGLVELLKRTNQIKSLKLPLDKLTSGFNIPDDLIPDLESFGGRADLVPAFCNGRPVRELRTYFTSSVVWELTDDVPNVIRPGSVPLEHLSIDLILWEEDTMGYIARHCPELVSLKVRAKYVSGTLSTRSHMPRLRRATFLTTQGPWFKNNNNNHATKMESEDGVVRGCREFWMGLEYLRLDPNYFWKYRGLEAARFEGPEVE
ncbi:hypothetical protein FRC01_005879 [Tulasnella sp. 417]|nr:hypothetical protein FRC01_005879 [Tulasnella sp. 417]